MGLLPVAANLETALKNAGSLALTLNRQAIATEHLLYGLASTPNSVAYKLLKKYGVTEKKLLKVIKEATGNVSTSKQIYQLDFSPISKGAIEYASRILRNCKHVRCSVLFLCDLHKTQKAFLVLIFYRHCTFQPL